MKMALVSTRNDPFGGLLSLQSALGRLLENPAPTWRLGPSSPTVFPPINAFYDKAGALVVRAEAPGIDPEKVQIDLEPERLTISGERLAAEPNASSAGFHRRERRFGRFSRSLQLPADLDVGTASATYRDGMLTLRIEKAAKTKPRRIEVQS
jgi:HSP20 family protein